MCRRTSAELGLSTELTRSMNSRTELEQRKFSEGTRLLTSSEMTSEIRRTSQFTRAESRIKWDSLQFQKTGSLFTFHYNRGGVHPNIEVGSQVGQVVKSINQITQLNNEPIQLIFSHSKKPSVKWKDLKLLITFSLIWQFLWK
ncbi:Hypothetical_protein [Hexamita inflata]|uniref:Hypothetical_protein n=1 Tax=Hexamita inflata TaxID=28002 RepID=A0AA86Q2F2_9EUKA|nr:Hypothetical protein HINF_LOCUS32950 [Hexamita inflata]